MFKDILLRLNKDNRNKTIVLILFIIIVSSVLLSHQASAYERLQFTDGLTSAWHPGSFCIPCHYTLLGDERAKQISSGCTRTCHANRDKDSQSVYKIDMSKISLIHKNILCIRCHVGTKSGRNVTAVDFHRVMSKTECLSCHTFENGSYVKPKKSGCSDCHGSDPHVVHGKRLEKMCEACHGEFAMKYINKLELPPGASNTSLASIMKKSETIKEYSTIGEIITGIIKSLIGEL